MGASSVGAGLLALVVALHAGAQPTDTARQSLMHGRDLIYLAGFAGATATLVSLDERIAMRLQRADVQGDGLARHAATDLRRLALPGTIIIGAGLYAAGRVAHSESVADLGLHGTEAIALAAALNGVLKGTVGRARPYVGGDANSRDIAFGRGFAKGFDYSSFASGHTAIGFALATVVTRETARVRPHAVRYVVPLVYGGATLIGLSRMYNDQHWASDIVAAAGIGTLSGVVISRLNHSEGQTRVDRWLLSATVTPMLDGSLAIAWSVAR